MAFPDARRPRSSAWTASTLAAAALGVAMACGSALGADAKIGVDVVAGRAAAGMSASRILKEGFPAARISAQRVRTLRVLVADLAPNVILAAGEAPVLTVARSRRVLIADHRYEIARVSRGWRVRDLDGSLRIRVRGQALQFAGRSRSTVRMVSPIDRRFRGVFELRPGERGSIAVVNRVGIEEWVGGAAGGDAPRAWLEGPPGAMDVAAILARSRAAAAASSASRGSGWDLTSDDVL